MSFVQPPPSLAAAALALLVAAGTALASETAPRSWTWAWPDTDFSKAAVDFSEIRSGGPPKDGIPSIDSPAFISVVEEDSLDPREPVIGLAVGGEMTGMRLDMLPSRLESWARFKERHPEGQVLVPNDPDMRRYGDNPYIRYDSASQPFLYDGSLPQGIEPMAYVVAVGEEAWTLGLLREQETIERDDLRLSWSAGKASALDSRQIAEGRDIGNVVVQRRDASGAWQDAVYDLTFAFVFHAFRPEGRIHRE